MIPLQRSFQFRVPCPGCEVPNHTRQTDPCQPPISMISHNSNLNPESNARPHR